MSTYVPAQPPHPLGQRREEVERIRKERRLDEKGFPLKPEEAARRRQAAQEGEDE